MVRGGSAQAPVPRSDVSFRLDQKTFEADQCSGVYRLKESKRINAQHENAENKRGAEGGRGQLQCASLVDGISISNHMAKHRNTVFDLCRLQNVAPACNAGGSSSLHTTMNASARLMQGGHRRQYPPGSEAGLSSTIL
jgi:hypothetical protein